jgi:hypothetical protein
MKTIKEENLDLIRDGIAQHLNLRGELKLTVYESPSGICCKLSDGILDLHVKINLAEIGDTNYIRYIAEHLIMSFARHKYFAPIKDARPINTTHDD